MNKLKIQLTIPTKCEKFPNYTLDLIHIDRKLGEGLQMARGTIFQENGIRISPWTQHYYGSGHDDYGNIFDLCLWVAPHGIAPCQFKPSSRATVRPSCFPNLLAALNKLNELPEGTPFQLHDSSLESVVLRNYMSLEELNNEKVRTTSDTSPKRSASLTV